jgi:hypothetical protein
MFAFFFVAEHTRLASPVEISHVQLLADTDDPVTDKNQGLSVHERVYEFKETDTQSRKPANALSMGLRERDSPGARKNWAFANCHERIAVNRTPFETRE